MGELNPYGADPTYALYPYPVNSAGGRLCRRVLGLEPREYLRRYRRVNLCARRWSLAEARAAAAALEERGVTVLLGAKVCAAFRVEYLPFSVQGGRVVLPHPSGRCRAWNEPGAYGAARAVLREAGAVG